MAQELEQSLRRRSESEPPDPSSIRSLNLSYQAKIEEEKKRHSADSPGLSKHEMLDEDPIGGRVQRLYPPTSLSLYFSRCLCFVL